MELHEIPGFEKARFEVLPVDKLFVDSYQRNVSQSFVNRIAKKFSPVLVGVLICSARDNGLFAVVDGQHRFEIMKSKGITHVPCFVFPMMVVDEALAFIGANKDRNYMTATAIFWANIDAKDPVALAIKEAVESCGFFITQNLKGGTNDPREIAAVGALNRIYLRYAKGTLKEILSVMSLLWVNDQRRFNGTILSGLGYYISTAVNRGEYDRKKLITALRKMDVETYKNNLGKFGIMFGNGDTSFLSNITPRFIRSLLGDD